MFILHKTGMDESCYHSTHDYSQHSSIQCSITWFVGHTSKDNPMTDPGLVGAVGQAVGDFCSDFFLRALVYLLSFQVNLFGFTDSAIVTEMLYGGKIIDCLVVPLICSVVKGRCLLLRLMDRFC